MIFVITPSDVWAAVSVVLFVALYLALWLPRTWRQWHCKHDGEVNETQACDAICRKCGKNLGFIATWRERQRQRTERDA